MNRWVNCWVKSLLVTLALVLVAGCAGDPSPTTRSSAHSTIHSPTPPPDALDVSGARQHRGWPVVAHARADLDGDGVRDLVRVREPDLLRGLEVDVVLVGGTVVLRLPGQLSLDFEPVAAADLDGRPGEELFVMREVPVRSVTAYTWRGDRLVAIPAPAGRRLSDDYAPDAHARDWWLDGDRVLAYRSLRACHAGWDTMSCPETMRVAVEEWRVAQDRWRVRPLGRYCVERNRPERLLRRCGLA